MDRAKNKMEKDETYSKSKQTHKKQIFVEPATIKVRPYLVDFIMLLVKEARQLPRDQLLGPEG